MESIGACPSVTHPGCVPSWLQSKLQRQEACIRAAARAPRSASVCVAVAEGPGIAHRRAHTLARARGARDGYIYTDGRVRDDTWDGGEYQGTEIA